MAGAIKKVIRKVTGGAEKQRKKLRREEIESGLIGVGAMEGEGPPGGPIPQDLINRLQRDYFLGHDDVVTQIIWEDKDLRNFLPAVSHLNRTTRISKEQGELQNLIFENSLQMHKLTMDEDDFENQGMIKLNSLAIYARCVVYDAIDGHRSKLFGRQEKVIRAIVGEAEKKKILP